MTYVPKLLYMLRLLPSWLPGRYRFIFLCVRLSNLQGPVIILDRLFKWLVPSASEPVAIELIANGCYEKQTCEAIKRFLPPDGVLIDVGANIGAIAIRAAKIYCPSGLVLGFEASPTIYRYLIQNVEFNSVKNIKLYPNAVGRENGKQVTFFEAPESKFGMGSMANRFHGNQVDVEMLTLDHALSSMRISKVHVLKVDVEGFELDVFRGASALIEGDEPPVIIFEFNDWAENQIENNQVAGDAQRYLLSKGYRLQSVGSFLKNGKWTDTVIDRGGCDVIAVSDRSIKSSLR